MINYRIILGSILFFISISCTDGVDRDSSECEFRFSKPIKGELFLLMSINVDGEDQIKLFKDRCSSAYQYVFFNSWTYQRLESILKDAPEQTHDSIKLVIIDAHVYRITSSDFDSQVYLVNAIYNSEPIRLKQFEAQVSRNKASSELR